MTHLSDLSQQYITLENQYGAHNYKPLPVVLTKGQGVYVWDVDGKRYIDMMSAYSAVSLGHCHPKIIQAIQEQISKLGVTSRAYYSDTLGSFLKKACELSGMDMALSMNSGAEAVETALKAVRKWGYKVKGVPEDQAEIIVCENNFHGRTIAIVGMSTEAQYRDGFGPFPPGIKVIPFNDAKALEQAITPNTVAFLVEPIQGEAGIHIPTSGYLKACETICRRHNVLLLCDEIQTGLGRTGKWFAFEHDHVKPDGLMLGKALGGGYLPVSLFLARKDVMEVFTPGDHGSTFGGNALSAVVGLAALETLWQENLAEHSATLGQYFLNELQKITCAHPAIKEIRGKGLFIGIELNSGYSAREYCLKFMELGLLSKETHGTVIRLAPPLVITKEEIDKTIAILKVGFK